MQGEDLLALIWSGAIEVRSDTPRSPLASLLGGVLAVPTVCFQANIGLDEPIAFADGAELVPGVQLGDVLAEELDVEVPVNSVILIEPASSALANDVSVVQLGRDLGSVLEAVSKTAKRDTGHQAVGDLASGKNVLGLNPGRVSL